MSASALTTIKKFFVKDKRLGSHTGKRAYDLPLDKTEGTGFLMLLIALMTFLCVLALSSAFSLQNIASHWSSGLENKLTIEVPAQRDDSTIRTQEQLDIIAKKIQTSLTTIQDIDHIQILSKDDIQALVSPWLGDSLSFQDLPLPVLISVDLRQTDKKTLKTIKDSIQKIDQHTRINGHENWLSDIIRFTGILQLCAIFIILIITVTTTMTIAGALRARMIIHKKDIELLHLMGASDHYIARQFQRHAAILSFKGTVIGFVIAFLLLITVKLIIGNALSMFKTEQSIMPIISLLLIPGMICVICALTARFTVLRTLVKMP